MENLIKALVNIKVSIQLRAAAGEIPQRTKQDLQNALDEVIKLAKIEPEHDTRKEQITKLEKDFQSCKSINMQLAEHIKNLRENPTSAPK